MKNHHLKNNWFIIGMVVILTIGFIVTSVLSYLVTRKYIVSSAVNQTLPLISDNIYSEITKELVDPINVSSLMANDTFLINWITNGEKDLPQISEYLRNIKDKYGFTSAFFVSEKTANYYYYDGILKTISPQDAHDIWYYNFKALKRAIALDVDTDEARNGVITVFINHRLESLDGTLLGVTGVGLELKGVGEKFAAHQKQFGHEIYIVDQAGNIQINSDSSIVEKENFLEREGIRDIRESILTPSDAIHIYEYNDKVGLKAISIRYIPEFNWYLIIEKNQETSLLPARQSLWVNILIGLFVTFGISILMIFIFRAYNRRLEDLASYDDLTQLFNRRQFTLLLEREINLSQRYDQKMSLLMLDIDDFKSVNDRYGHTIGDEMLKLISGSLKQTVRTSDIVGRWGGEEFVVLLVNTGPEEAMQIAERILFEISKQSLETKKGRITRTVSIGLSTLDKSIKDDESIIHSSDEALMRAKAKGKNTIST